MNAIATRKSWPVYAIPFAVLVALIGMVVAGVQHAQIGRSPVLAVVVAMGFVAYRRDRRFGSRQHAAQRHVDSCGRVVLDGVSGIAGDRAFLFRPDMNHVMTTPGLEHWQAVYRDKSEAQTSWFREHLDTSLHLIDGLRLPTTAPVIDVGGGRSTLADDLLARGFSDITVLDIAEPALATSRLRLGDEAQRMKWLAADITSVNLPAAHFGLWHDRAAFHFLVDAQARARYVAQAARALRRAATRSSRALRRWTGALQRLAGVPLRCRHARGAVRSGIFARQRSARRTHDTVGLAAAVHLRGPAPHRISESMSMLKIDNLHVRVGGKEILKGLTLAVHAGEMHAIMGPNGAGKSTLGNVLAGREGYEVTAGSVTYNGTNLLKLEPEQRAAAGMFLAFQYPVEIPGVNNTYFLKAALNAQRKYRGEAELDSMQFLKSVREKLRVLHIPGDLMNRAVNVGFSGGEKKRNEIFRWRCWNPSSRFSTRPIRAWISTRSRWSPTASTRCVIRSARSS